MMGFWGRSEAATMVAAAAVVERMAVRGFMPLMEVEGTGGGNNMVLECWTRDGDDGGEGVDAPTSREIRELRIR